MIKSNKKLKKMLAAATASVLLFSYSTSSIYAYQLEPQEYAESYDSHIPISSGENIASKMTIYNNTRDMDITDNPAIYLDNTNLADGKTMNTVTVTLADDKGQPITGSDFIVYEVSENENNLIVEDVTPQGVTNSVTLNLYAEVTEDGKTTSLDPGNVTISFSNKTSSVTGTLRCSVYCPSTDMNIFWDGADSPLPLNDFCETNSVELYAVMNHSYQLTANVLPANSTDTVTWAVWDGIYTGEIGTYPTATEKASIDANGVFTAKEEGTVTIVAKFAMTGSSPRLYAYGEKELYSSNGQTSVANVKTVPKYIHINIVKENPAVKVSFEDAPSALEENESYTIKYNAIPTFAGEGYGDATDKFKWETSDPSVAVVSQDGVVTAVSKGEATITMYGESADVFAEQKIKVLRKAESIEITPSPAETRVGVSIDLTAKMLPQDADDEIIWSISDSTIASLETLSLSSTAIITGLSVGKVTVTAEAVHSGAAAECEVTVLPSSENDGLMLTYESSDTDISIVDGTTITVYTNQDLTVHSGILSKNGEISEGSVEWEISGNDNNDFVTVPDQNESQIVIHGTSEGTVTIIARSKENSLVTKRFNVEVLRACDYITLTLADGRDCKSTRGINLGGLRSFKADPCIDGNYPHQHSDKIIAWVVEDPTIAQVDNNGNVRGIKNGTTKLTAIAASGKSVSGTICVFTTSQIILGNVTPSSDGSYPTATLIVSSAEMKETYKLNVTLKDQNNTKVTEADCVWSSSDPSVATVDPYGVVTPHALGTCVITASSGSKSDSCLFAVNANIKSTQKSDLTKQIYSPIKQYYEPKLNITFGDLKLIEGIDYHLEYKNNSKVGTGYVNIIGDRWFNGNQQLSFSIQAKQLTDPEVQFNEIGPQKYTAEKIVPEINLTCFGLPLTQDTDYEYYITNNFHIGTARIELRGKGNYLGKIELTFEIYCNHDDTTEPVLVREPTCSEVGLKKATCNICKRAVEIEIPKLPHTYAEKIVPPTANEEGYTLHYCTVCNESYKDTPVPKVEGINITDCVATLNGMTFAYTGSPIEPPVTLRYEEKTLVPNADYLVTYVNNVEIGQAYAIITGMGMYVGTGKVGFMIAETGNIVDTDTSSEIITTDTESLDTDDGRIDITQKDVGVMPPYTYSPTKTPYTPKPVIQVGSSVLAENVDYVIAYANNYDVGTASVVMRGIGKYKGVARFTFEILPKSITDADVGVKAIGKQVCTGSAVTPQPVVMCETAYLANRKDYKVTYSDNIKPGIATATITGIGNYTGTLSIPFQIECTHKYTDQIVPPTHTAPGYTLHTCDICGESYKDTYTDQLKSTKLENCDIRFEPDAVSYTGEPLTPDVTITDPAGKKLVKDTDYKIEYSNNTNVGIANATITGIGAYNGIVVKTFQIFNGMIGDVNFDESITAEDALMTLRYTVGLTELNNLQLSVADVNGDDDITTEDSLLILRHAAGFQDANSLITEE